MGVKLVEGRCDDPNKKSKPLVFLSIVIFSKKSHSTEVFLSSTWKHSHFLFLSVTVENAYTLDAQGNHSNCSRTVEGERVQEKGRDICQLQKAFSRKENEQIKKKKYKRSP